MRVHMVIELVKIFKGISPFTEYTTYGHYMDSEVDKVKFLQTSHFGSIFWAKQKKCYKVSKINNFTKRKCSNLMYHTFLIQAKKCEDKCKWTISVPTRLNGKHMEKSLDLSICRPLECW